MRQIIYERDQNKNDVIIFFYLNQIKDVSLEI
jgi:hypothetical protein